MPAQGALAARSSSTTDEEGSSVILSLLSNKKALKVLRDSTTRLALLKVQQ